MAKEKSDSIIELTGVHKKYLLKHALKGIDLQISKGSIVGLLGPNGSGKSTLLKLLAGFIYPSSGTVRVNGRVPDLHSKREMAYLPEIDHLYSWMTVSEILAFLAAFYPDWHAEKAEEMMATMELDGKQKVKSLSKGMRARLKLICAFSRNVSLVLLDEPFSGIDPPSRSKIIRSIIQEYVSEEQTILLSTHAVNESEPMFDEVIFLQEGQVKIYDSAENLRAAYDCSLENIWEKVYA